MSSIPASTSTPPAAASARGRPATCPRCQAAFECGVALPASAPCACAGVGLAPALRTALATRFEGCLCLACLRAVAGGEAIEPREAAR